MTAVHLAEVRPVFAVPGRRADGTVEGERVVRRFFRTLLRGVVGVPIDLVLSIGGGGRVNLFAREGEASGPAGAQALAFVDAATSAKGPWSVVSAARVGLVDAGTGIVDSAPEFRRQAPAPAAPRVPAGQPRLSWPDGSDVTCRTSPEEPRLLPRPVVRCPAHAAAGAIDSALASGCHPLFTPGICHLDQTLNVTRANTVVLGIGYPTLIQDNGVNAMRVSDVDGVRPKGPLFDAGTTDSAALLTVGQVGSGASHASNPTTVRDVFFRIGGAIAGRATTSLIVNSDHTVIDHVWAWRADHGNAGTCGWTRATGDTGLIVNGDNVLATGLFVEHYQKCQVIWNGQHGKRIFFQNEMPYDVPNRAGWKSPDGRNGYAAHKVADPETSHEAWGLGSYCFFDVNPSVSAHHAFEVPDTSGVRLHNLLTVYSTTSGRSPTWSTTSAG